MPPTSAGNSRGFPAGTALTGLIPRRRPIARCMPLGRLISGEPAHHGVAEVIWSALRGVVRVQIIMNAPIDWQRERLTLIDMVTLCVERNPQVDPQSKRPGGRGDPAPPPSRH